MLDRMLKKTVDRFPQKTAVVCGDSRITYRELYNKVEKLSLGLTSIGVKSSECVALILPNCPEFVISFYGIARIGAIALFLNPSFKESELEEYIRDSKAVAIVTDLTRAETCSHLISKLDRHVNLVVVGGEERSSLTFDDVLAREVETFQQEQFHEGDVLYLYSSGSTGKPKRVSRTQKNIFHQANNCVVTLEIAESDNIFCIVPLYHGYGFGECLLAATHSGATLVILEPCLQNGKIIEQPFIARQARVLEAIAQEKITILPAVPYIYSVLAAIPSTTPADLSTLRLCISAGNFLPKNIFDKFYTRFCIAIRQSYGCTEAGGVAINMQSGADFKYDSIGLPMKNVEIKIIDEAEKELPLGVVGEVAIKSQTLTRGYDNAPDANKEAFKNGYFLTGDLGKKDEEGYLYITGRKKLLIDTGGYKVNPLEVEAVLAEHPKVSEAIVVGVSDAHAGQLVKAVVVPKGQCREQDIFDYCQDKLAEFKIPKIVEFRQEIPKSSLGKILREKLVTESANLSQNLALKAKVPTQHNRSSLKSIFVPPRNHLEQKLVKIWENILNISPVGVQDNFFELGLNSIDAMRIANRLQEELELIFHVAVLFEEPTIEKFANYLQKNYSKLVQTVEGKTERQTVDLTSQLNVQQIEGMRQYLLHFHSGESIQSNKSEGKNKQAIFILCPPRSGSTLLRVMLAGHPQLFAPPELYLLSFNTLAERKTAFSGRNRLFTEGLIRAIMEIKNCNSEQARQIIEELEEQNLNTKRFFSLMQEWLSDQILVDKTPLYAFNPQVLQRAEEEFENPLYVHLLRYPLASIHSMEQIRFDLLVEMKEESDGMFLSVKQKGELMWLISHKNILEFLKNVPSSRQYRVKYEDLVQQTQTTVNSLCKFIGVDFHADMLQPYREKKRRMTDGIDSVSRMMGDPKFHTHKSIDAKAADRWKEDYPVDFLAEETWQVAEKLGYDRPSEPLNSNFLPLTIEQEYMWWRLEPTGVYSNTRHIWSIEGALNLKVLQDAIAEIARRHTPLHTTFKEVDGSVVQVVRPEMKPAFKIIDLPELPEKELWNYLEQLAFSRFDLIDGPMVQINVLRLSKTSHILMTCINHIANDAWSWRIFIHELNALYSAFASGQPSPLPPLPMTFTDFARWYQQWLREGVLEKSLNYWRKNLAGAKLLKLPTDRQLPANPTFSQGDRSLKISPELSNSLKKISNQAKVILYVTLLSAYGVVLSSLANQEDFVIDANFTNRPRAEAEYLIGNFVNILPMRVNLKGNLTFAELLDRVQHTFNNAYTHKNLSFRQLVEIWQDQGQQFQCPIAACFNLINFTGFQQLELPEMKVSFLPMENKALIFKLNLRMLLAIDGGYLAQFCYMNEVFDGTTVARIARKFHLILETVAANPQKPLADLYALPL